MKKVDKHKKGKKDRRTLAHPREMIELTEQDLKQVQGGIGTNVTSDVVNEKIGN